MYEEFRSLASELISDSQQGVVEMVTTVRTPGENSWDPPTEEDTPVRVSATVAPLETRFLEQEGYLVSDRQVTVAGTTPVVPVPGAEVRIDGRTFRILDGVEARPSAGTVAVYVFPVRGAG